MKKIYIQPTIEVETIETSNIMAGSPHLIEDNYDGTIITDDINNKIEEGDGGDFAKGTGFWTYDDFED